MKISLIMTTQGNRDKEIVRLFKSLESMNYKNYELIFVNQSSSAYTNKLVLEYSKHFSIKEIKVKKCELSKARNLGLRYCRGDIVAFPDDDCWYPSTLFSDIIKLFKTSNLDFICTSVYDPYSMNYYGKRRNLKKRAGINIANIFKYSTSVGIFIRRESLDNGVRFDERFGAGTEWGCGEEVDFLLQVLYRQCKGEYFKALRVYHLVESYTQKNIRKYYRYAIGFGALIAKSIVIRKQYKLLLEFLNLIIKSILGMLIMIVRMKKVNFIIYFYRLKGLIQGYYSAKQYFSEKRY